MPATPAWLAAVEALFGRGMEASMQATALARRLEGTALRLDVAGLTSIRASVKGGRLALAAAGEPHVSEECERVDATLEGSLLGLLRLAGITSPGEASRPVGPLSPVVARTAVRGDAEIANLYRQLFTLARPDFEEELSRIVGDVPARGFSNFARRTAAWLRDARRTAGENVAEYLQEESRDLVGKPEVDDFLQGVDAARETLDRVEARLVRLEQRFKGSV
ncbi:MAG: hypothetical protein JWN43_3322 [Gammaproteobacteria bacterium]|nr:hypothetical protein [Gammaproteobacteria bacterium]